MAPARPDLQPGAPVTSDEHFHLLAAEIAKREGVPMWRVMRALAEPRQQFLIMPEAKPGKPTRVEWKIELS